MQIVLLEDFMEGGVLKYTPGRAAQTKMQRQPNGSEVATLVRSAREPQAWLKGTIITASEATGKKLVKAGKAKAI